MRLVAEVDLSGLRNTLSRLRAEDDEIETEHRGERGWDRDLPLSSAPRPARPNRDGTSGRKTKM